ncbi:hypothetical protein AAG570_012360 [Ranatra chinensis]|uniref:Ribosome-recycling factor, mitochondrial n=1 Tax=Ranatra chinensis TaxID=642074 RepID=A0ABD0Z4V9_9HEMI
MDGLRFGKVVTGHIPRFISTASRLTVRPVLIGLDNIPKLEGRLEAMSRTVENFVKSLTNKLPPGVKEAMKELADEAEKSTIEMKRAVQTSARTVSKNIKKSFSNLINKLN